MRRIAAFLVFAALAVTIGATPASAAETSDRSSAQPRVARFCRATDDFLRFFAKAPDPRAFDTPKGRRVLRTYAARAPKPVTAATARIVDSFTYLSVHGRGSLAKARDEATGDALFRVAVYGAAHCKQRAVQAYASAMVQRRIAQQEAKTKANEKSAPTSSTTNPAG
jgi:hypothetical protein